MQIKVKTSVIGLLLLSFSWAVPTKAADFYTIIGPDGRPMIIKNKDVAAPSARERKSSAKSEDSAQFKNQSLNSVQQNQNTKVKVEQEPQAKTVEDTVQNNDQKKAKIQENKNQVVDLNSNPAGADKAKALSAKNDLEKTPTSHNKTDKQFKKDQAAALSKNMNESSSQKKNIQSLENNSPQIMTKSSEVLKKNENYSKSAEIRTEKKSSVDDDNFTIIDGVQYVNHEYLEEKEFNLEGNKRFYIVPDSSSTGGRNFETVEREKGVTKSVLSKFLKNTQTAQKPIVLATTYARLNKDEVVETLEQACFTGRKINKSKTLSLDKDEIGFWPVAPVKENFSYEVVNLDQNVETIHLSSYASSQKNPTYYWPLVVFLDQNGCVIEGVSGFKNEDIHSNNRAYSALAGILKKPDNARYLFMTPLAEAIDIKNQKLSNTGQIKLSVLR